MPIVAKNTERDKELWRRWKAGERISVMARELALNQTRVHAIVHQVERLTQDASERGIVTRKVATLDEAKAEFERIWIASGGRGGFLLRNVPPLEQRVERLEREVKAMREALAL